ncbi:MAG: hypothetical protein KIT33_03280 [Candidatus Kapabacteria bacterium]|nr:hypothetical protein [Ignavibacteriota bacterium]MCW5883973.1 hypothetical protein [Candidatus Kapabacteria bacterium]
MNKLYMLFIPLIILAGCINLREPYPVINYYELKQEPTLLKNLPVLEQTVMIRRVFVNETFDTPHFLISTPPNNVERLFYHRWISDVSTLATDFVATRINQSGLLKHGVLKSGSIALPEYIVEPHLIEMTTYNDDSPQTREYYVQIEFKVDYLKRLNDNKLELFFSSNYKQKFVRRKYETKFIAEAYSRVFSMAVDNIISDLSNIIK